MHNYIDWVPEGGCDAKLSSGLRCLPVARQSVWRVPGVQSREHFEMHALSVHDPAIGSCAIRLISTTLGESDYCCHYDCYDYYYYSKDYYCRSLVILGGFSNGSRTTVDGTKILCFFKSMFMRLSSISLELLVAIRLTATKNPDQRCYSYSIPLELTMS